MTFIPDTEIVQGCACMRGVFDFCIEIINTTTIKYTDLSDWMTEDPYVIPEYYPVFIDVPPPKSGMVTAMVKARGTTILTSEDLGLPCDRCIYDGFYCFNALGCYNCDTDTWGETKYSKTVLLAPRVECEIENLLGRAYEDHEFEKADSMRTKLKSVEAKVNIGQLDSSRTLFRQLRRELESINCNFCNC